MCSQVDDDKEVKKENYGEGEPLRDVEKVKLLPLTLSVSEISCLLSYLPR